MESTFEGTKVSAEKSADSLMEIRLYITSYFSPALFKIFFPFTFDILIRCLGVCLCVILFQDIFFFSILGMILVIISSNRFSASLFHFLFDNLNLNIHPFDISHESLKLYIFTLFLILFFPCYCSAWVNFIVPSFEFTDPLFYFI